MSSLRSATLARSGETRTIEKSDVPPPMSMISASSSLRHAVLIVESSGDRFELESNVLEAALARGLFQFVLRLAVRLGIVVDEIHGPSKHDIVDGFADLGFSDASDDAGTSR